jgi:carboxylesterase type B
MIFRWIQNNIEDYGGNPDDVTIVGMSAGGASVNYLTLSPQTKGLYKNAISLSGSSLCWWASIPHPREQVSL